MPCSGICAVAIPRDGWLSYAFSVRRSNRQPLKIYAPFCKNHLPQMEKEGFWVLQFFEKHNEGMRLLGIFVWL